jgi:hypothetical protein
MKHTIMLALLLAAAWPSHGQEMWGMRYSNYGGTQAVLLNPSAITGTPYRVSVNLLTTDVFLQNSFFYVPSGSTSVPGILGSQFGDDIKYDIYSPKPQQAFTHLQVTGPSFSIDNGRWAWGFHSALRNQFSLLDVPYDVIKLLSEDFHYDPFVSRTFHSDPFTAAFLSWGEYGATAGKVLLNNDRHYLKAGITLNYLAGYDAGFLSVNRLDYTFNDSSAVLFHVFDATLSHAVDPEGNLDAGSLLTQRGSGLSTSFGVTYIWGRDNEAYRAKHAGAAKYRLRAGLSVVDLGSVRFQRDARYTQLHSSSDLLWSQLDTARFHTLDDLDDLLSNQINGMLATENRSFTVWLPAAICLQTDVHLVRSLYAGVSWMNRIRLSEAQVMRTNQVNLALRVERKQFDATASLTFSEYRVPSAGLALRYSVFTLGTDRLMEWLGATDIRGVNAYFGIQLNLGEFGREKKSDAVAYGNLD